MVSAVHVCENADVRLSVRVGLDTRLLGDVTGMPSLIPFSSPNEPRRPLLFGLGSGRLLSGPARPERTSYEDRRCNFKEGEPGKCELEALDGVCACDRPDESGGSSRSLRAIGGELKTPGGRGRGPRKIVFSRLCSCACCCRIVCFSVDIWVRMATIERRRISIHIYGECEAEETRCCAVEQDKMKVV